MLRTATLSKSRHTVRRFKNTKIEETEYILQDRRQCFGINILETGVAGFIERFGKLHRPAEYGLNYTIPLIETIRKVTLREVAVNINPQSSVTKDNVQVTTAGAVYFKVCDPQKACYATADLLGTIVIHAQSSMRSAVGLMELDTLFHNRSQLNEEILKSIQSAARDWGVDIYRYEITEVTPDQRVSEAMDSQSIAERKRRETSLKADAQRQHDITVSDGKRLSVVNEALAQQQKIILEAEANKQRVVLAAEAEKESRVLQAEAEAEAIAKIGNALKQHPDAAKYFLARDYLDNVSKMLPKSTVFLPKDIGDVSKLVATATSISQHITNTDEITKE